MLAVASSCRHVITFDQSPYFLVGHVELVAVCNKSATILRLLGNETIQFNTRIKKSELVIRKQLKLDVKSTTKLNFFFKCMNIFIYFTNIRCFRFSFLYFKHLQILIVCVRMFLIDGNFI